jgi:hypothetical protein
MLWKRTHRRTNVMFKFLRKTALWILLSPIALQVVGAASNQLVLIANRDTFPVNVNAVKLKSHMEDEQPIVLVDGTVMIDDVHCIMSSKTHLNFLADEFDLGNIYSVGDFGIVLGEYLWGFAPLVWGVVIFEKLRRLP